MRWCNASVSCAGRIDIDTLHREPDVIVDHIGRDISVRGTAKQDLAPTARRLLREPAPVVCSVAANQRIHARALRPIRHGILPRRPGLSPTFMLWLSRFLGDLDTNISRVHSTNRTSINKYPISTPYFVHTWVYAHASGGWKKHGWASPAGLVRMFEPSPWSMNPGLTISGCNWSQIRLLHAYGFGRGDGLSLHRGRDASRSNRQRIGQLPFARGD